MRRLWHLRLLGHDSGHAASGGFDPLDLPGDPIRPATDEGWALRPGALDLPGHLLPDVPPAPEEPAGVRAMRRARELTELGRRLDAIQALRQLLDEVPGEVDARALLAELLDAGDDSEEALTELDRALGTDPRRTDLLVQRGGLLIRLGRAAEAEKDLRRALGTTPTHAEGLHQLGLSLLRRGKGTEAIAELVRARQSAPEDDQIAFHLGEAHHVAGDLPGALEALQVAARLAPNEARTWQRIGRVLDQLGRTEDAMAMYRKAREVSIV